MARNRITKLRVREVSGVDRPANQYADILLMKRDGFKACGDCPSPKGCATGGACRMQKGKKHKGGYKPSKADHKEAMSKALEAVTMAEVALHKALNPDGEGSLPNDSVLDALTVYASTGSIEKAVATFEDIIKGKEQSRKINDAMYTLQDCISSVMYDKETKPAEKPALLAKNLKQFIDYMTGEFPSLGVAVSKSDDEGDPDDNDAENEDAEDDDSEDAEDDDSEGDDDDSSKGDSDDGTVKKEKAKVAKNSEQTITKADHDAELAKRDLEIAKREERIAAVEKKLRDEELTKAANVLVGDMAVDKAKVFAVLDKLDADGTKAFGEIFDALRKQNAASNILKSFGSTDSSGGDVNPLVDVIKRRNPTAQKAN